MKRRLLGITIFFIIGAVIIYLITIPKVENWTYDLPNNYVIKKTSDTEVVLGKYIDGLFETGVFDKKIGVEDYIAEFSYSDNYITLKCLIPVDNGIEVNFYIIDSLNDDIYGPYSTEEVYNEVLEKIVDEKLSDWIETINMPDEAINE